jgi:NSS family neurotransmitter:Na+ symporter
MGIMFFFIMFIAAISSSISLLEVMVAYLIEEFKANRMKATLLSFGVVLILGTLCALSQGVLSGVHIFKKDIFDFFDFISANVFMTGGGLLAVIFVGWKLSKLDFKDEFTSSGKYNYHPWFVSTVLFLIKYLAPVAVALIMINGLI